MQINITSSCFDGQQNHLAAGSAYNLPLEDAAAIVVAGRGSAVATEDAKAVRDHLRGASDKALRDGARLAVPRR